MCISCWLNVVMLFLRIFLDILVSLLFGCALMVVIWVMMVCLVNGGKKLVSIIVREYFFIILVSGCFFSARCICSTLLSMVVVNGVIVINFVFPILLWFKVLFRKCCFRLGIMFCAGCFLLFMLMLCFVIVDGVRILFVKMVVNLMDLMGRFWAHWCFWLSIILFVR